MPDHPTAIAQNLRERLLGITFFSGTPRQAVALHVRNGGYVVSPAAPALLKFATLEKALGRHVKRKS